jgi:tRNA(fMet)-specific endonuclease VapC
MNVLLLDTNVVSILFKASHPLRQVCLDLVSGQQLAISFMTQAELLLWPTANEWGEFRRAALLRHMSLYTTLYPDGRTCAIWADVVDHCRRGGHPIQTADAWIAATAQQWSIPLVTTDFRDYSAIENLDVVPVR